VTKGNLKELESFTAITAVLGPIKLFIPEFTEDLPEKKPLLAE